MKRSPTASVLLPNGREWADGSSAIVSDSSHITPRNPSACAGDRSVSSRRTAQLAASGRAKQTSVELIDPKIVQFKDRVVGSAGDSLLLEFASPVDAVQCAMETHEQLTSRNLHLPETRR